MPDDELCGWRTYAAAADRGPTRRRPPRRRCRERYPGRTCGPTRDPAREGTPCRAVASLARRDRPQAHATWHLITASLGVSSTTRPTEVTGASVPSLSWGRVDRR